MEKKQEHTERLQKRQSKTQPLLEAGLSNKQPRYSGHDEELSGLHRQHYEQT